MRVKKYIGKTTREALRKMREDLGNEAMILSSKQTPNGIEMIAMDQAEVNELVDAGGGFASIRPEAMPRKIVETIPAQRKPKTLRDLAEEVSPETTHIVRGITPQTPAVWRPTRTMTSSGGTNSAPNNFASIQPDPSMVTPADPMKDVARAMQQAVADQALRAQQETQQLLQKEPLIPQMGFIQNSNVSPSADPVLLQELKNMRAMLENQMSSLAWRESMQRNPTRIACWRELHEAGFSPGFARVVAENLPENYQLEKAREWVQAVLLRNLPQVAVGQDLVEQGGVWALVGPTGVGKTTTTAKLAARCVVKYGANALGLITTDTYRVGAHDQLKIYAKILGVPVYSAHAGNDLQSMLNFMARRRLVLIDTVGMGQRDERVTEQIAMLSEPGIQRILLLNAAAQSETLEDVVQLYGRKAHLPTGKGLSGAILTKLDEAVKLGPVLDIVMRHKLLLHFMTNGQRVPEDLHNIQAPTLIQRTLKPNTLPAVFALSEMEFDQTLTSAPLPSAPTSPMFIRGHIDATAGF